MALVMLLVLLIVTCIQRFYLRTSRQLRLLDIEMKAQLYSSITETSDGLVTIRAFGSQEWFRKANRKHLDRSQRPMYLLYTVQRWLTLVLELLVAGIAVVLVGLASWPKIPINPGIIGVALVNLIAFSQSLTSLVKSWVALETSIGAIMRVKNFAKNTESEGPDPSAFGGPKCWSPSALVSFNALSATYRSARRAQVFQQRGLTYSLGQSFHWR